ncbi:MAG: hypothetical protein ABI183_22170 [Polyangiaceae bacterium]
MVTSACSLISTFDGLTDGGANANIHDAGHDASSGDTGGGPILADAGDADADACTPGVTSCGRGGPTGVASSALYRCDETHAEMKVEDCQYGCVTQQSSVPPPETMSLCSPCFIGGEYCGGDKIGIDPDTLYICNPDGTATVVRNCGAPGCRVGINDNDDACN